MTSIEKQLEAAIFAVHNVTHDIASSYCNGMGLRLLHAEREARFKNDLTQHGAPEPLNIRNSSTHFFNMTQTPAFMEFAAISTALELSEKSEAFITAHGILQPMTDEVRRLEDARREEVAELSRKTLALAEAEAFARSAAEVAIGNDPAVIAARKELEALAAPAPSEPAKPFRGRVTRSSPEADPDAAELLA